MIVKIFTVYDSKIESYLQPFFMMSKGAAVRALTDSVSDATHQFAKYPEDFTLFELGSFDDADATFTMHPTPISLGVAVEFMK
jgi:hypothetical protein